MASVEFIQLLDRPPGSAKDWWNIYDKAVAEAEQGATMRMGMVRVVGQKPSDVTL